MGLKKESTFSTETLPYPQESRWRKCEAPTSVSASKFNWKRQMFFCIIVTNTFILNTIWPFPSLKMKINCRRRKWGKNPQLSQFFCLNTLRYSYENEF